MLGKYSKLLFLISLIVTILVAATAIWTGPYIVKKQIQKSVQLDSSSQMFDKWKKLPIPLNFKIRVFNVTNPDEVNSGEKPKLAEIGPYVYKEYREKRILDYGENDTIRYMLKKSYFFDQEQSGSLTEDDEVTVINFSYLAAILAVEEIMPSFVGTVNQALEQFFEDLRDPFLRVKVRDLFFDGVFLNCSGDHSALGLVCGKIKSDTPQTMRPAEDGTGYFFSMFSHLNRTESGPYEVVRGRDNLYELGRVVSYKNKTVLNNWRDPYCGQINGTDSSIFPPIDQSNVPRRLYSFEPDICRSLYVEYVEERSIFNLSAYYYEIPESALAAKSANKNNKCFCRRNWSANHDGCLIMGVLNLAPCQGAPAIASFPHFYMASEELLEYFNGGIEPEREKHATYLYLDPLTGVVLRGAKRLQFNIELRNIKGIPQLENVSTGLFPLLWIEEGAEIPVSIAEELQASHKLVKNVKLLPWIFFGIFALATVASACAVLRMLPFFRKHTNSVSFILNSDANKVRT